MPLRGRPDGVPIRNLPTMRQMMPHLMPSRNGAVVYFDQHIDVTDTLAYLERRRTEAPELNFFQIVLAGLVRTLALRPQMHRFVVGRRLYQRRRIELSFAVKKRFEDEAKLTMVKASFEATDTLDAVAERVRAAVGTGKGERSTTAEREMALVTRLPGFALRLVMALQRVLDSWNLLPASMIQSDPMYASMVVANLGSIGLDAAYHHLYEYGTVPVFAALGRIHKAAVVMPDGSIAARDRVTVRFSFDERIADGLYAARSLELFRELVEDPPRLEVPPASLDAALPAP
jgi:hypothetical protein